MSNSQKLFPVSGCGFFIIIMMFLLISAESIKAQSFDHEAYPKLDFDFQKLELDLGLQPQNLRMNGAATYQIQANVSGADTVTLYAAHMDISAVSVDDNSVEYSLHNDSLFVPLEKASKAGQQYSLSVRYSASPKFGLLRDVYGTVWTSQLPRAQRHWVPIVDNPHVAFKTTLNISVPSGYQVWATGRKTGQEAASVDVMKYHFSSDHEVPASALALAVGRFDTESTSFGVKTINLAVEHSLSDSLDSQQLLQDAYGMAGAIEDSLGREYPYSRLNIVVLADHTGETKQWGASTVFVYQNMGNLRAQLMRGIVAQWFGVYQRETQWQQADAITLYQTLMQRSLSDSTCLLKPADMPPLPASVYSNFGTVSWNRWLQGWSTWNNQPLKTVMANARGSILEALPSVISWEDYAKYWYRHSGQPLFEIPEIEVMRDTSASVSESADSVAYRVTYNLNEADGQLKLSFKATHGVYKQLTSLRAYEVYPNRTDTSEVTFTGARDSVMLKVDPMISTLRLEAPDRPHLYLDEYKPAPFLIYELHNASTVKGRIAAAEKLGYHTDNPDLQLAIKDFLSQETESRVKAALLSSLGNITNGAAGTEDTFLQALKSEHRSIRNAALMALQHYKDNVSVREQVQSIARNADRLELFKKATQVYTTIASAQQFQNFADQVTQQDSVGHRSIFVIQQLANMGEVDRAVTKAALFAGDDYSYQVRRMALQILIQHDHTPSDWLSRAKNLLESPDPRIRYWIVQGLARNRNKEITDFLSAYMQDEYDARMHKQIEQVLHS